MKKLVLSCLALFVVSLVFAQSGKYVIKGEIKNCADTSASLTIWKGDGTLNDDISVKNGKFVMEGECSEPMMVRVSFQKKEVFKYVPSGGYIPYKCSSLWFLVYPGVNATVKGELTDFVNAYPGGDAENNLLAELTKVIYPIMNECGNIQVKLESETLSAAEKKALNEKHRDLNDKMMKFQKEFVTKHASSYAAIWFIDDMMARKQLTPAEAALCLENVKGDKYTSIAWYDLVKNRIGSTKYAVGNKLASLKSKNSVDGKEFSIESLKGKYVIIDFWGTWCGPCMSGMASMRAFRDEYNDKVEILGIAKDDREGWLSSIEKDNLNWIHLLNGKGEEDFVSKFNVTGYPTKILIAPDGTILHRESGESEAFYDKVKSFVK